MFCVLRAEVEFWASYTVVPEGAVPGCLAAERPMGILSRISWELNRVFEDSWMVVELTPICTGGAMEYQTHE